jgi:hypothetical protein
MSSNQVAYTQKRRSSRIGKAIPLAVQGVDALRAPFREEVTTATISCHGCTYQMKHEVLPGSILVLNIGQQVKGNSESTSRARVKWIQKLNTAPDSAYRVAVEFEYAGNIWGITPPPADWFPVQRGKVVKPNPGQEMRLVARAESQAVPAGIAGSTPASPLKKNETAATLYPWFSDLMGGLSNQIQVTVTEIAAATLAKEKNRLLEEFRAQIQKEAAGTIERVIATSQEDLTQRALKLVNEAAETTVRTGHERLVAAIEQDLGNAKQRMLTQGKELSERVDGMATSTIERFQNTLETSRTEAAARFVSRMREEIAPVLEEANADLQKLVVSQTVFKEESQAIYARATSELENSAKARLILTHGELDKRSAALLDECKDKLLELSQSFENAAQNSIQTMIASATGDAKKNLEVRAGEISSNFTSELEGHIRNYLEFISDSIAEFPKNTPAR